jgi:hypothetical protein
VWVLNSFLFFMWLFNQPVYQQMKAAGEPCYAVLPGTLPDSPQPECFYDPTNFNPASAGMIGRREEAHR